MKRVARLEVVVGPTTIERLLKQMGVRLSGQQRQELLIHGKKQMKQAMEAGLTAKIYEMVGGPNHASPTVHAGSTDVQQPSNAKNSNKTAHPAETVPVKSFVTSSNFTIQGNPWTMLKRIDGASSTLTYIVSAQKGRSGMIAIRKLNMSEFKVKLYPNFEAWGVSEDSILSIDSSARSFADRYGYKRYITNATGVREILNMVKNQLEDSVVADPQAVLDDLMGVGSRLIPHDVESTHGPLVVGDDDDDIDDDDDTEDEDDDDDDEDDDDEAQVSADIPEKKVVPPAKKKVAAKPAVTKSATKKEAKVLSTRKKYDPLD